MRSSSEWLLVLPVVALGMASGCCRPSGGGPAAGGPPGVSAREAVLADMKGLQAEPPDAVEGYVSEWGTAGALVVRVAGGQRVVVGDQAGPVYEAVAGVVFSQDGRHVAYVARDHGRVVVVRDGKPGAPFDEIGELLFTRDGQHLVHRGVDDGKAYLVIDGRRGPPAAFDAEPFWSVKQDEVFVVERPASADRLEVAAWSMTLQRRVVAVVEGGVGGVQSQDGTRLAVVVAEGGKQRVVSFALATPDQRVQGQPYDEIGAIAFDATGTHVAYLATLGDKHFMVLDDRAEPIASSHLAAGPSIDAKPLEVSVGYAEGEGVHMARLFGAKPFISPSYAGVSELVRSPDGLHTAHTADRVVGGTSEAFLVVDGAERPERFDKAVSPRFSPDGKYLVFRARKDGKRFMVVADAAGNVLRRHPVAEQVFEPAFTPDGASVAYAVKDGPALRWRVERLDAR